MDVRNLLAIMPKYNNCPNCNSAYIGNGQGEVIVKDNTFTRSCECGFSITVDENGKEIK